MAQLSDDCFAFGGPMMSVDDAVAIITARVAAVHESETVPLPAADGRGLARDITAPLPLPPFTNSPVDGYAVRGGAGVSAGRTCGRGCFGSCGKARPCRADFHGRADAFRHRHGLHAGRCADR